MFTLNIDHEGAGDARAPNYSTNTLRPGPTFPISIARSGTVLSVYADDVWDLSPYAPTIRRVRFLKRTTGPHSSITAANIGLQKLIAFWTLYAMGTKCSVSTIHGMFYVMNHILRMCSLEGVVATDLYRFPALRTKISEIIPKSQGPILRRLIYRMVRDADLLGFTILTVPQVDAICAAIGEHTSARQTLFIPERIYLRMIEKCLSVVTGFVSCEENFRKLFSVCTRAYAMDLNARKDRRSGLRSFSPPCETSRTATVLETVLGANFERLARHYGVLDELNRQYPTPSPHGRSTIRQFSFYLDKVRFAARLLITALTGMRVSEVSTLRLDCLETRDDPILGKTFFIRGKTSKTRKIDLAAWVTAPEAEWAVKAARIIVEFRNFSLSLDPRRAFKHEKNLLFGSNTELWMSVQSPKHLKHLERWSEEISSPAAGDLKFKIEFLLGDELRITPEDYEQARRLTPSLPESVAVGKIWPLAWHQFRRTIICLALGAGVSLPAIAWQAKHSCTAMTLHYGRNYFNLGVGSGLSAEFKLAEAEIFLIKESELISQRYISPTGVKERAIKILSKDESKAFAGLTKQGKAAFRRTSLGYCMNPDPCEHGGWEDISHCTSCDLALIDREREPVLNRFLSALEADIEDCSEKEQELRLSLLSQKAAVCRALNVIGASDE